eukprot:286618-Chlamydomonas_euryale.AAC.1
MDGWMDGRMDGWMDGKRGSVSSLLRHRLHGGGDGLSVLKCRCACCVLYGALGTDCVCVFACCLYGDKNTSSPSRRLLMLGSESQSTPPPPKNHTHTLRACTLSMRRGILTGGM